MRSIFPRVELYRFDWIVLVICSIPAFYLLGQASIYIFDEAVYANASWDMAHGSSWLIPTNPEYNTKPPLVLWLQAISLKIFPLPEFAIRLPSALSVTGIMLIGTYALKRWGFQQWSRILFTVFFVGNEGFIRNHISRTGDLDAVMTLFEIGYVLVALDAIYQERWTTKHFFWFFLMFVAAYFSKSIGGWLMMGPLAIVWLLSPVRYVLFSKKFLLGLAGSVLICSSYYLIRESLQPGFLALMFHSEYLRMVSNVMPWHEHGFGYYFKNFVTLHFYNPWIFIVALSMVNVLFVMRDEKVKKHALRWVIISLGFMILISIPPDKLEWYDAPAYPFFAMILCANFPVLSRLPSGSMKYILVIPVAFILWRKIDFIQHDVLPRHPFENEGYMLRNTELNADMKVFMKVATPEHELQLDFYTKVIKEKTGRSVDIINSIDQISEGDKIIISQSDNLKMIGEKFDIDTLKTWNGLGFELEVKGMKFVSPL